MSRIGKKPIVVPKNVTVHVADGFVSIKGPKGEEKVVLHPHVQVVATEGELNVNVSHPDDKQDRALWGLFRALLANQVEGVVNGFEKKLEMQGVGFKANIQGKNLVLEVGFSHSVTMEFPAGIEAAVEKNIITIKGINKQVVGEFAASVRAKKKPEPYQGKGIRYVGEVVRKKAGKAAKAAGAAGGAK
ncbi:MAG: 50S ribosomal protein L6 [Patescibacteria group bacterium]